MLKVYFVSSPQSIPTVGPLSCLTVGSNIIVIFPNFICGFLNVPSRNSLQNTSVTKQPGVE